MVIFSHCMKQLRTFLGKTQTRATNGRGALLKAMTSQRSKLARKSMSHELSLTTSAEFLVYPVPGKVCAIVLGQFVTRKATADELDDIAFRFHQAARETRRGVY